MCGIFGIISQTSIDKENLNYLVNHSRQRGRDSSGLIYLKRKSYHVYRADYDVKKLLDKVLDIVQSFFLDFFSLYEYC